MGLRFCHMPSVHYSIYPPTASNLLLLAASTCRRTERSSGGSSASTLRGVKIMPVEMAAAMAAGTARYNTSIDGFPSII